MDATSITIIVGCIAAYLGVNAFLIIFRPELWDAKQRRAHEAKLASDAQTGTILGSFASAIFAAASKNRPH
ncbi:hypothetical protein [Fimbriiglobus ruber]|uniref:Uncharacterized protein n=1 Tax=Fimbriiglobus ruber TaxID=1908690 RepID=A0A225E0T0_9BACT|nr:hypothetical protein [Fimbriiglobus ruber]OWK41967.1 hypothetical protein FRUB_04045 [Fimbriiglobus ruber]